MSPWYTTYNVEIILIVFHLLFLLSILDKIAKNKQGKARDIHSSKNMFIFLKKWTLSVPLWIVIKFNDSIGKDQLLCSSSTNICCICCIANKILITWEVSLSHEINEKNILFLFYANSTLFNILKGRTIFMLCQKIVPERLLNFKTLSSVWA